MASCVPPTDEVITEVNMDFTQPELQRLYGFVDRQEMDSLVQYVNHPDPAFRILVAYGFGSIKTEEGLDSLAILLNDHISKVRAAATYAMGQTGSTKAVPYLMDAFKNKDTIEVNSTVNSAILEAIGKTGDESLLKALATVSTYRNTDTLLLLGQARAIYRFGLRNITLPEGTDLMVEYVTDKKYPDEVRLVAAHYLQRIEGISIEEYKFRLTEAFSNESNPYIRMALASSLSKTTDRTVLNTLIAAFDEESDYRVKVNILRAFRSYPYIRVIDPILKALNDENIHVANTAADFLIRNGNSSDATMYKSFIQDSTSWPIKTKIYSAILNNLPPYYTRTKSIYKNELLSQYESTNNPQEKAAILAAMAYDPLNYNTLKELGFQGSDIEKTRAMEGMGRILRNEDFVKIFRGGSNRVRLEIIDIIKEGIASRNKGLVVAGSSILSSADETLKELIDDLSFLEESIASFDAETDKNTIQSLQGALAHLKGEEYTSPPPTYNHPIDWSVYNSVSDSSIVNIKTSKGLIKAVLYNKLTPGTVSNFVDLINKDYFDQKVFHRVVPNFVVQTGSLRGDGYGSSGFTIRSELPQLYYDEEGYLGMASSGPHTESTQWFITHSPTPHLDGNYTIFGKVNSGMDVVHAIEVGDVIQDIIISKK